MRLDEVQLVSAEKNAESSRGKASGLGAAQDTAHLAVFTGYL